MSTPESETNAIPVGELTYRQASEELETIIAAMQGGQCDIDRLIAYTRRAMALIDECRRRLTTTDEELQRLLDQVNQ